MKILYLHQYFCTPKTIGGTRSYEMGRRLAKAGHEVIILTSSAYLGKSWAPKPGWHSHKLDGIRLEVLHVPYSNEMPFHTRIKMFFKFALAATWHVRKFKADIVFATSTPLTITIPAIAAKFWHRIPMVFEVRDLWPELPIAIGALKNPLSKIGAKSLEWLAYHASAHVVALSPGIASGVMKRGIPVSKISIIPNSCDIELFDIPSERGKWVRNQLGLKPNQPLIVYVGSFGLINGLEYLLSVASFIRDIAPEITFLLVGSGAEKDKLTAKAKQLGILNKNLWIWPPKPKIKIPDILAASTLATSIVIPLKATWKNSANKFFDTLAAGKPVAINYGGWQADLLKKSGAGIVLSPSHHQSAAHQLLEFIREEKSLEKASKAARNLAYKKFNRDSLFIKLENVLKKSVSEKT